MTSSMIIRMVVGGVAGVLFGLAVYKFIGCRTGTCPLTGNPYIASVLWGIVGLAMAAGK